MLNLIQRNTTQPQQDATPSDRAYFADYCRLLPRINASFEMPLIVSPVFRSEDAGLKKLITRHISVGFSHPETYHMLLFSFKKDARDHLHHAWVYGGKT